MKSIARLLIVATFFILLYPSQACSQSVKPPKDMAKGLIGEAIGEGYQGMYAVACVYRNRLAKGMTLGCCALKRKDINQFVDKQPEKYIRMANNIVQEVFSGQGKDITHGATHYENVEKYGTPYWAKGMTITCKIGHHTFFRR